MQRSLATEGTWVRSWAGAAILAGCLALLGFVGCGRGKDQGAGRGPDATADESAELPTVEEIVALMRLQLEIESERRPEHIATAQISFAPDIRSSDLVVVMAKYPDLIPTDVYSRDPGLSIGSLRQGQTLPEYFEEVVASAEMVITNIRNVLADVCAGKGLRGARCDRERLDRLAAQQQTLNTERQVRVYGLGVRGPHASLLRLWNQVGEVFASQLEPTGRVEGPPIRPGMNVDRWY